MQRRAAAAHVLGWYECIRGIGKNPADVVIGATTAADVVTALKPLNRTMLGVEGGGVSLPPSNRRSCGSSGGASSMMV